MKSYEFSKAAKAKGLLLRCVSAAAVDTLSKLARQPVSFIKRNRRVSHEGGLTLGPLIMHGLVKLEIEASKYVITDKGRDYLAKLETAGLLGKEPAA